MARPRKQRDHKPAQVTAPVLPDAVDPYIPVTVEARADDAETERVGYDMVDLDPRSVTANIQKRSLGDLKADAFNALEELRYELKMRKEAHHSGRILSMIEQIRKIG